MQEWFKVYKFLDQQSDGRVFITNKIDNTASYEDGNR